MADGVRRGAAVALAVAAAVLGIAAGYVLGRASVPPPPPQEPFLNPLADAKRGENLLLRRADGETTQYRVLSADEGTVRIVEDTRPVSGKPFTREFVVARSYMGFFYILEGEVDPAEALASARDFVMEDAALETVHSEPMNRSFRCWRIRGHHRVQGDMTFWVTHELPVHGLLRVATDRGTTWEAIGRGQ